MTEPRDVLAEAIVHYSGGMHGCPGVDAEATLAAMPDHLLVRKDEWANAIAAVEYAARSLPASGSRMTQAAERRMRDAVVLLVATFEAHVHDIACNCANGDGTSPAKYHVPTCPIALDGGSRP